MYAFMHYKQVPNRTAQLQVVSECKMYRGIGADF